MSIRALIVDDEELARRGIRARLERAGGVEVVAECAGGREAVARIDELAPDLVFLDVQMPGLDGFGVVERVGAERMPPVVFVTAYDEHALRAFDASALDYLLKPIDDDRFTLALDRARRRIAERRESAVGRQVAAPLAPPPPPPRILVRDRGRVLLVDAADVDWVEADGDYVRLHVAGRGHLLRETMAEMQRTLDPARFARIHRSAIVNVSRIVEVRPSSAREHIVLLRDGTRLRLSRRYRARLGTVLGGAI